MNALKSLAPAFALLIGTLILPAAARAGIDAQSLKYLDQATASLYNLNYADCRKSLQNIIAANPESPFGYVFEAGEIWWEFSGSYVYPLAGPDIQSLMMKDVNTAFDKARPMLSSADPGVRADGNFATGMALGLRGQWSLLEGRWFDAYFDGRKSLKYLRAALANDPSYYDADLGLGIYDYEAAKFGRKIKMGFIMGAFDSERRGIKLIGLAKDSAHYSADQAAVFLLTVYMEDKHDYRDALPLVQELRQSFPQSPYFEFAQAIIDYDSGFKDESFVLGENLFNKFKAGPKTFEPNILNMTCSFSGDSCLDKRQMAYFIDWINGSMEKFYGDKSKSGWLLTLHLLRGYGESISGDKPQADADYREVLAAHDFLDYHARAQKCLSEGCSKKSILTDLQDLAR